jgi:hypothetical protein
MFDHEDSYIVFDVAAVALLAVLRRVVIPILQNYLQEDNQVEHSSPDTSGEVV